MIEVCPGGYMYMANKLHMSCASRALHEKDIRQEFPLFFFLPCFFSHLHSFPLPPQPFPPVKTCSISINHSMSTKLLQSFRADSSSKIITIPVVRDTKNGGHDVIRWKDIQQCFADAKYITNRRDMVNFMSNEDLEE